MLEKLYMAEKELFMEIWIRQGDEFVGLVDGGHDRLLDEYVFALLDGLRSTCKMRDGRRHDT